MVATRKESFDITITNKANVKDAYTRIKLSSKVKSIRCYGDKTIDVQVSGISKFPDSLVRYILDQHGEIEGETLFQNDHNKIFTGHRFYKLNREQLEIYPLPPIIKSRKQTFYVDYEGQPRMCYKCKEFGHIKRNCPKLNNTFRQFDDDLEYENQKVDTYEDKKSDVDDLNKSIRSIPENGKVFSPTAT